MVMEFIKYKFIARPIFHQYPVSVIAVEILIISGYITCIRVALSLDCVVFKLRVTQDVMICVSLGQNLFVDVQILRGESFNKKQKGVILITKINNVYSKWMRCESMIRSKIFIFYIFGYNYFCPQYQFYYTNSFEQNICIFRVLNMTREISHAM